MFLTPFIDFGEPIERIFGLPPIEKCENEPEDKTLVETEMARSVALTDPHSGRVRIIGVSDRIKIISASDKGTFIEGTGIAIGSGPLDQSKAYFEVHIEQDGTRLCIGAIGRNPTTVLSENWQVLGKVPNTIASGPLGTFNRGDTIGIVIDISDFPPCVSAYGNNDELIKTSSSSVRGDLWPAIELTSGSVSVIFHRTYLKYLTSVRSSRGIEAVMLGRSII